MKFEIIRTSQSFTSDVPPCPESRRENGPSFRVDARTCATPEELDARKLSEGPWLAHGTNHRSITFSDGKTGIARDMPIDPQPRFVIDFSTLEELLSFAGEHGEVIVDNGSLRGDLPRIEIYDGYRE